MIILPPTGFFTHNLQRHLAVRTTKDISEAICILSGRSLSKFLQLDILYKHVSDAEVYVVEDERYTSASSGRTAVTRMDSGWKAVQNAWNGSQKFEKALFGRSMFENRPFGLRFS